MFTIAIDTANDAFQPDPATQLAINLRTVTLQLGNGFTEGFILDVNGNRVGEFRLTDDANPA